MPDIPATHPATLPLADGKLVFWERAPLPVDDARLFERLQAETAWRQEEIVLFGKRHLQPRMLAWYGDPGASYRYSGVDHEPLRWTPLLSRLRACVEEMSGHPYNSVLLNLYRDHRDSMGMHADDEPELGPEPVIASLSLGETRTLVMRHRHDKAVPGLKLPLTSGSLLVMAGDTQRNWKHGINKLRQPCGPRINLTFRQILPDGG